MQRELLASSGTALLDKLGEQASPLARSLVRLRHELRSALLLLGRRGKRDAGEDSLAPGVAVAAVCRKLLRSHGTEDGLAALLDSDRQVDCHSGSADGDGGDGDRGNLRVAAHMLVTTMQKAIDGTSIASTARDATAAAQLHGALFAACDHVRDALAAAGLVLDDPCACGKRGGDVVVMPQ